MLIREHAGHVPLLLLGHGREFRYHGKVGDGVQVLPVLYLVVEQGQAEEPEDAGNGASRGCGQHGFSGVGGDGESGPWAASSTRAEDSVRASVRSFSSSLLNSVR